MRNAAWASLDYNVVHLRKTQTMFTWGNDLYPSLAAFKQAGGQEAHGLEADPLWEDAASGKFDLLAGSPAIDSGNSGADGHPSTDSDGDPRLDDSDTPNTGAGPRTFDDRGAHEFAREPPPARRRPPRARHPSSAPPAQGPADASGAPTPPTGIDTYKFASATDEGRPHPSRCPTHVPDPGPHGEVTVTDTAGNASERERPVVVRASPPSAELSYLRAPGRHRQRFRRRVPSTDPDTAASKLHVRLRRRLGVVCPQPAAPRPHLPRPRHVHVQVPSRHGRERL